MNAICDAAHKESVEATGKAKLNVRVLKRNVQHRSEVVGEAGKTPGIS
jgi:hypothetical protein